ncbi:MAG TPA: hypothetical protein VG759_26425 [Candidatus Angelobacter sp.]|jgi:hypothetical protein|nr:hypothetical protein [Candidatus Angelobacter sp.]
MNSLFTIDHILWMLWMSIIVIQFWASWVVVKKGFYTSWKAFSYYLFVMAANSVILLAIKRFGSPTSYGWSYYGAGFIEAVLLSLVVLEILVKVLDPFEALPGRNIAWFCFWAVIGISVAIAVSVSQPLPRNLYFTMPLMVQRTIFLADAGLLWVVLLQARSLGVTWKSSVAEIAMGFVLFLTVQAITKFLMGIYLNELFQRIASGFGQAAYLCSLCGWIWTMFHRDPLPPAPSAETLTQMRAFNPHALVPKEKIFAAVGVKINKLEPETELAPSPAEPQPK